MLSLVVEVTRLLSNIIKYPFVNMQGKEGVLIRHEQEEFTPLLKKGKVMIRPADEVRAEEESRKKEERRKKEGEREPDVSAAAEFSPGMPVVNFDELQAEKEQEIKEQADKVLGEAKSKSDAMLAEAEEQVESIRQAAREEGLRQGMEEGMAQAQQEIEKEREELRELTEAHEREYAQLLEEIEPRYSEILSALIQKITGVLVEDDRNVFLHLIRSGLQETEPSGKYTIRVATEKVMYVEGRRKEILAEIGRDVVLDIQEEKGLEENDCIIETEHQMVDCGFHTQLNNLVSTLRMLS